MPAQERTEFCLECSFPMVLLLIRDVFADCFQSRLGNGEGAVSGLPGEIQELAAPRFDPFRRGFFDFLDDVADAGGSGQVEQKMNMVVDGIDEYRYAFPVLQN